MKKKLTDEHLKKIKLMLRTMNQAHIARKLGLSKKEKLFWNGKLL
jgi:hypothetical protein